MTQFEYYSHNEMKEKKDNLSNDQITALKELLVERIVDNMSTEDLVEYVSMDLDKYYDCLLYTSPSPRDKRQSRMPSSA